MSEMSENLVSALKRAVTNNQPPGTSAETELNNRGFMRFADSGGYEYVNRHTVGSPTADQMTHVILFQHEPIIYQKLDSDMHVQESRFLDTPAEILAFLDGPDYTG